jgi:hypothetical protein
VSLYQGFKDTIHNLYQEFFLSLASINKKDSLHVIWLKLLQTSIAWPIAAGAVILGHKDFTITSEALAQLERNYYSATSDPISIIFLQLITLHIQIEEAIRSL